MGQEWKNAFPDFSSAKSEKDLLDNGSLWETELPELVPEQLNLEFPFPKSNPVGVTPEF